MKTSLPILLTLICINCTEDTVHPTSDGCAPAESPWPEGAVRVAELPDGFTAVVAWFQAVGDSGGTVEVAWAELRAVTTADDDILLARDGYEDWEPNLDGGLYIRDPWFPAGDYHEPMPAQIVDLGFDEMVPYNDGNTALLFTPADRPDRVWHWWTERALVPSDYSYIYVRVMVRVTGDASFQAGADWYESLTARPQYDVTLKEAAISPWVCAAEYEGWTEVTLAVRS